MKDKIIKIGSVEMSMTDYAISGTAILGIRDSGKTVTGKGIAEQLLDGGIPIIVFDAVGKWRWLKTAGAGPKAKGYKVVVVGGRFPDLPLNPHSISEIVRASIKQNISLVIDLYDPKLSKSDWRKIVQQSIRIIHYENEGVRHVILEEAAEYIPQKVQDGETYAEVEKFVRMGGNASVGITIINQRSQEVNKSVLDLCSNLVLGCQVGSKAIEAVEKWVDRLSPEIAREVTTSLPRLKSGQAWVWTRSSPDKPTLEQIPMCRSFHPDRRTPDAVLKEAVPVDAADFVSSLARVLPQIEEERKANDPAELRREIARLKKEATSRPTAAPVETKEVPILTDTDRKHISDALFTVEALELSVREHSARALASAVEAKDTLSDLLKKLLVITAPPQRALQQKSRVGVQNSKAPVSRRPASPVVDSDLTGTQQKIVDAIHMLGVRGLYPDREMIARWLSIHPNGGRYGSDLAALRAGGFIDGCELTPHGIAIARDIPTGIAALKAVLDGTQVNIVEVLESGQSYDRETLSEQLGIHPNGGRYGSDLARLRTMGVIPQRGEIKLLEAASL